MTVPRAEKKFARLAASQRRWPLRLQILVPHAVLMIAVLIAVSLLNAVLATRLSQRQIEQQLQGIANTLAQSNFPLSDAVLRQVSGLSGAEFILTDAEGNVLATGSPRAAKLGRKLGPSLPQPHLQWDAPLRLGSARFFHMALDMRQRITLSQPHVLHILYPEAGLREAKRQAAYPSLVVGGVALVTTSALGLLIAHRLSRPMRLMSKHVQRLTEAQHQPIPLPKHNDELRDLVVSVNGLAGQLDEMRMAIRRSERLALLGQLSGGIAHHLRNNVAGARLAVQLHQRTCASDDAESLQVALRQLTLTEEHLVRLLTAGRPLQSCKVSCSFGALLEEAAALVEPALRHHKIALQTSIDAESSLIHADPDQIRSVILGLLLNASEAAGPEGWVRVSLDEIDDALRLRTLDSGPGPAPEIVDRLFEPFATTKREGVGLGLAVAWQVAQGHGGTLRYVRQQRPTCFELVLPRQPSPPLLTAAATEGAPRP